MALNIAIDPSSLGKNYDALHKYLTLEQYHKVQCEYIWIGGTGSDIRSKTRTLHKRPTSIHDIPCWNYDGSSTGQAEGSYSEIWLQPVKFVPDPFRGGNNILCLCECLNAKTMSPIPTNRRRDAYEVFKQDAVAKEVTWYGLEQEYTLFEANGITPLGWPTGGFPAPQGPYYCSIGDKFAHGRHVAEAHYRACLFAGLEISGSNAETMPGQWEYQCGPCVGIDSGDQLWLSRYILNRIAEDFGVVVSYEPKPVKGNWNGAGCHANFSTESMRADGGMKHIMEAIKKLGKVHDVHIKVYGERNAERLTGKNETASYKIFKYGVADRNASIRIPRQCEMDGKGYLEDRRPAANCDPYAVTSVIAKTTILNYTYDAKEAVDEFMAIE